MARNKGGFGSGSKKMGGAGIKSSRPPTAMAGSGIGAAKGSPAASMGAPPMAPKVANIRPPGIGTGAPPPMPGGSGGPPASVGGGPGGSGSPGGGAGSLGMGPPPKGIGGSGGFKKGGSIPPAMSGGFPPKEPKQAFRGGGFVNLPSGPPAYDDTAAGKLAAQDRAQDAAQDAAPTHSRRPSAPAHHASPAQHAKPKFTPPILKHPPMPPTGRPSVPIGPGPEGRGAGVPMNHPSQMGPEAPDDLPNPMSGVGSSGSDGAGPPVTAAAPPVMPSPTAGFTPSGSSGAGPPVTAAAPPVMPSPTAGFTPSGSSGAGPPVTAAAPPVPPPSRPVSTPPVMGPEGRGAGVPMGAAAPQPTSYLGGIFTTGNGPYDPNDMNAHAKGGSIGYSKGGAVGDSKPRYKGVVHKGR